MWHRPCFSSWQVSKKEGEEAMRRETRAKALCILIAALCLAVSATVAQAGSSFVQPATRELQPRAVKTARQPIVSSVERQSAKTVQRQPFMKTVGRQPAKSVRQPAVGSVERKAVRPIPESVAIPIRPKPGRSVSQRATQFLERTWGRDGMKRSNPPAGPFNLNAVHMVDADRGWAVGDDGIILKTEDGGWTWTHQTSGTSEDLLGVDSFDGYVAYAVGEGNTLLRTSNGGRTWNDPRGYGAGSTWKVRLTDVYVLNHYTAVAVGGTSRGPSSSQDYGYVATYLRTSDGGLTWTTPSYPADLEQINAVEFMDDQVGIAVGGYMSYSPFYGTYTISSIVTRTEDGGLTWQKQNSPFDIGPGAYGIEPWGKIIYDVAFFDEVNAAIVAEGGVPIGLSADEGRSWSTARGSICNFEEQSITYVDAATLVAVGQSSVIRSIDGGRRWETVHSIGDQACFCLKSVSAAGMTVVAVGCNSQILRSDDGGATWDEVIL
jgi:photosystem II stability/assembly factor-like uncharacterized protein